MSKLVEVTLVVGLTVLSVAGASVAQQRPGPSSQGEQEEPTELVFEREVFDYPRFERRNPFVPLLSTAEGPRFEQMRLQGILLDEEPSRSLALVGSVGGGPGRRLRVGESWGNVRILEIRRTEVLVQVEEFGQTEQRVMTLRTRGQGGS